MKINIFSTRLVTGDETHRLFKYDEQKITNDEGDYMYTKYSVGENTYSWTYFDNKNYWAMISYGDKPFMSAYSIGNTINEERVYNKLYIRPVINLKKCAIDNTCE